MRRGVVSAFLLSIAVLAGTGGCARIRDAARLAQAEFSIRQPGHQYRAMYSTSAAMAPTILVHGLLIVDESAYATNAPAPGDIVVFYPPLASDAPFIKRVVGSPGDRLRIEGGVLYRNDRAEDEPYTNGKAAYDLRLRDYGIEVNCGDGWRRLASDAANVPDRSDWPSGDRVPRRCLIVLGDNRNDSEDSHIWGCAQLGGVVASGPLAGKSAKSIVGKVVKVLAPE